MYIKRYFILACLIILGCGQKQTDQTSTNTPNSDNEIQVSHLSDTLTYYLGLIKSVPDKPELPDDEVNRIQKEHRRNIGRLADLGLISLAGPFWKPDNSHKIRGLFLYKVDSKAEADTLAATDPAVKAGRLKVENYSWLGSANMAYDTIDGADGMRSYNATIFWRYNTELTPPTFDELYQQQSTQLESVSNNGQIVMAGPFINCRRSGQPYALFIYSEDSLSTIEQIVSTSSAISDSSLTATTIVWYGPVGLRE